MKLWPTKKLGEVLELCDAGIWGVEDPSGMPLLRSSNMQNGRLVLADLKYIDVPKNKSEYYKLVEGDILITKSSGSVDHIGKSLYITDETDGKYGFSNFTQRLRANRGLVDPKWIYLKISNPSTRSFLLGASQTTTGLRNLKISVLKELEVPLPPLETQKKIVKKIEKLFAKIDQVQSLREASVQDANNLVSSALEQILHKSSGWKEFTIGELADDLQAGFACGKSNEVSDGVVHLRTHNIDLDGELNLDKMVKIPERLVNKSAHGLKLGDIIFNNTNSTELVGKTIIIRKDLPYAFSNHLNRIRVKTSLVLPEWILYIFQKYWRDKYFEHICTRWVGQSGINQGKLVTIKVPVPPLAEQKKIVARLDALKKKVRELQVLQAVTAADLTALKQSILHKAFQGELI